MEVSKVASWGTKEDRPERDGMRSRLVGHNFMGKYREAEGGKKEHEDRWWFDWVRENTVPELRWMWSSARAFKDEHSEAYAQVAGDLILKETAQGHLLSGRWFRTDISEVYGWLFEPACLRHDDWQWVELKSKSGELVKSWTRKSD